MFHASVPLPIGTLHILAEDRGIVHIGFCCEAEGEEQMSDERAYPPFLHAFIDQLRAYIDGSARDFSGIPLGLSAATLFQLSVWQACSRVPYGQTRTYGEIARAIGHPRAARAVGSALGANPCCIVIPCHRVVPASGGSGRYVYGTERKKWLLEREKTGQCPA